MKKDFFQIHRYIYIISFCFMVYQRIIIFNQLIESPGSYHFIVYFMFCYNFFWLYTTLIYIASKMITIETKVSKQRPTSKITSAIFS
jgi:hypothetical protein